MSSCVSLKNMEPNKMDEGQAAELLSQPHHTLGQNSESKNSKCKLSLPSHWEGVRAQVEVYY